MGLRGISQSGAEIGELLPQAPLQVAVLGASREIVQLVGILELLDAYRGGLQDEMTALDLELAARHARIELDFVTGGNTR